MNKFWSLLFGLSIFCSPVYSEPTGQGRSVELFWVNEVDRLENYNEHLEALGERRKRTFESILKHRKEQSEWIVEIDPDLFRPYLSREAIDQGIPLYIDIDAERAVDIEVYKQEMSRGIDSITVDMPPQVTHRAGRQITFYVDKAEAISGVPGFRIGKRLIALIDWSGISTEGYRLWVSTSFRENGEINYSVATIRIDEEEYRIAPITDTGKHVLFEVDTFLRQVDRENEKGGIVTDYTPTSTWIDSSEEVITFPRHDLDNTPPKKPEDIPPPPPLPSRDTLPAMEMLRDRKG